MKIIKAIIILAALVSLLSCHSLARNKILESPLARETSPLMLFMDLRSLDFLAEEILKTQKVQNSRRIISSSRFLLYRAQYTFGEQAFSCLLYGCYPRFSLEKILALSGDWQKKDNGWKNRKETLFLEIPNHRQIYLHNQKERIKDQSQNQVDIQNSLFKLTLCNYNSNNDFLSISGLLEADISIIEGPGRKDFSLKADFRLNDKAAMPGLRNFIKQQINRSWNKRDYQEKKALRRQLILECRDDRCQLKNFILSKEEMITLFKPFLDKEPQ